MRSRIAAFDCLCQVIPNSTWETSPRSWGQNEEINKRNRDGQIKRKARKIYRVERKAHPFFRRRRRRSIFARFLVGKLVAASVSRCI
ncbi:hypothetical protein TNIN_212721 [Trichonephila inaurata madagascariensis]|uniref:Uncharacterized protein n=1 Tax=Trichonephila inaurata madagascariensis TaxID=2747483 RepID=A0A8X6WUD3_9ARAC|nr:hypothetical protein TNIN_212721 [Trichonephila inaurata madagascariensis]